MAHAVPPILAPALPPENESSICIDYPPIGAIWTRCTQLCGASDHTLIKKSPVPLICCGCCLCTAGFVLCPSASQAAACLFSFGIPPCLAGLVCCACYDKDDEFVNPLFSGGPPRIERYGLGKCSISIPVTYPLPPLEPTPNQCYCCYENGRECYCCSSKPSPCCTVEEMPLEAAAAAAPASHAMSRDDRKMG